MLYNLLISHIYEYPILNLFRYITFRSGCAMLCALMMSFIIGPYTIAKMRKLQGSGQPIRNLNLGNHEKAKHGTPTMGGIMILFSSLISTLLFADISNIYIWILLLVTLGFGIIGYIDDYLKVVRKNPAGISAKIKFLLQSMISLIACYFIQKHATPDSSSHLTFPFYKGLIIDLGVFYYFFVLVVIVGASNAVNLTDGLDGLATVPVVLASGCFALISYLIGNIVFANYLQIHYVAGAGELAVFCCSLVGAGLGFLWYNAPPAKIFMGDTGSLALGGAIGTVSVITKHEIVLSIIGGLFVVEAMSVILQVAYFKVTGGKRIFKMSPIHHHFEKSGWSESTVVIRFWIIATIFALIGLSTLKLR